MQFQILDPKTWNLPLCGVPHIHLGLPLVQNGSNGDSDGGHAAVEVSDSIPWHRPFFWSPTCQAEATEALRGVLELIGCDNERALRVGFALHSYSVAQNIRQLASPRTRLA